MISKYLAYRERLLLLFVFLLLNGAQAQQEIQNEKLDYRSRKLQGLITPDVPQVNHDWPPYKGAFTDPGRFTQNVTGIDSEWKATTDCGCYQAHDSSWSQVLSWPLGSSNTDDGSTNAIALPFDFCFYGATLNAFHININGNISFGAAYSTFSAAGFPDPSFVMVAPFWGDVDLGGTGEIWYKITNTALIVNWEAVGYFSSQTDKVNTFSLIITEGTDPLLPPGNNVGFCYEDMQWTTGSASQGVNGFGGVPANVGINEGSPGNNFFQVGRYDQPGVAYDGPGGAADGVDWLDNTSFVFNSCNGTNIPPIMTNISVCDTLKLCVGDTIHFNPQFLAPELTQVTNFTIDTTGVVGFTLIDSVSNTNTASGNAYFTGTNANIGVSTFSFTVFDDGSPADTVDFVISILVDTMPYLPTIIGDTIACIGNPATLGVDTLFDAYVWGNGEITPTAEVMWGLTFVTVTVNGCSDTASFYVDSLPSPTPEILGDLYFCGLGNTTLQVDSAYDSYQWNNGSTADSLIVSAAGEFWIFVVDSTGCGWADTVDVINPQPNNTVSASGGWCPGDSVLLTSSDQTLDAYNWSTNETVPTIWADAAGTYYLTATDSFGCTTSDSIIIDQVAPIINANNDTTIYCNNDTILIAATASGGTGSGYTYSWNNGSNNDTVYFIPPLTDTLYIVTVYDACGIIPSIDSIFIFVPYEPTAFTNIDDTIFCADVGESATIVPTITGSGSPFVYNWSTGAATTTITVSPSLTTVYDISITDQCGTVLDTNATVFVVEYDTLMINASGTTVNCPGDGVLVTAITEGGATGLVFNWDDDPTAFDNDLVIRVDSTHTYTVAVSDVCGNTASDDFTMIVPDYDPITIITSPDDTICEGDDLFVAANPSGGNGVYWFEWMGTGVFQFDDEDTTLFTPSDSGIVTIKVFDECGNTGYGYIHVDYENCDLFIPSVFSPNNDGMNDVFHLKNLEKYYSHELIIYNRWGGKVYGPTTAYQQNWDGENHPDGVYYYILTVSELGAFSGHVTIVR